MKKILSLEEFGQFCLSLFAINQLSINLHFYFLIPAFFIPDLFALGYLIDQRAGAILYNFSHHKLVACIAIATGLLLTNQYWMLAGLLLYAHSSFDRTIGYGLKYFDAADHTHLGFIGKSKFKNIPDHF